jgi:pSer/pThr/pTyr-binding forkhead associated (FHA) protein
MAVSLVLRSSTSSPGAETQAPRVITYDLPLVVIGRGQGCDFLLPDLSVSHRHASIRQRDTDYIVMDEGSTNGTFVGAVRLSPQTPRVVRNGDMIRVGRVWLEVRIEHAATPTHTAQATKELALALVSRALDAQGEHSGPRLVVVAGPDQGKQILLDDAGGQVVIGRGRDVSLPLDVPEASRRHARVVRHGEHALLRDLGSRIGTMVRGEPAPADNDTILRTGDMFQIGPDAIRFEFPAVEALRELEQSEDEAMAASEVVPPPVTPHADPTPAAPAPSAPIPEPQASSSRSNAGVPVRRGKPVEGGWTKTDVIIVLLALAVLGMSAVGLLWLFRGL